MAEKLGSAPLLENVRTAFVHGMDAMLWTCGGIALAAAILAIAFLPRKSSGRPAQSRSPEPEEDVQAGLLPAPVDVPGSLGAESAS